MKNFKKIMVILLAVLFTAGLFFSCADASDDDSTYSDEEKAVIVNKAVSEAGTTSTSGASLPSRVIASGDLTATAAADSSGLTGSDFYSEISSWSGGFNLWYNISYSAVTVSVTDEDGNEVTVVMNGSISSGTNVAVDSSITYVIFGTIDGSIDGESFSFTIDLKTAISADGKTFTISGTAGGVTVDETYSVTAP